MIVCQECGNAAPSSDGFCSSCGVLLEWSGEQVGRPPTSPGPGPAGWSSSTVWGGPGPAPAGPPPGAQQGGPYPPGGYQGPYQPGPPQPPPYQPPPYQAGPYQAGPYQPPPYQPGPVQPGPVLPGPVLPGRGDGASGPRAVKPDAEAIRPNPIPIAESPDYQGPFCRVCGTRNAEASSFCRYCGTALGSFVNPAPVRRRWWQRLFGLQPKVAPAAGERPKDFRRRELTPSGGKPGGSKRRWRPRLRLSRIAPILVVLGLIGFGLGPGRQWINQHVSSLIGTAKQHVSQTFVPVAPVSASSSSSAPGHGAKLAIDGVSNSWWQSGDSKDGIGQTITVKFPNPVNIDRIAILSGVPGANFRTQARVRTMTVTVAGKSGAQLSFNDSAEFQNASVTLRGVTSVTFVIVASYPGQSGHAIAISEIEFDELQSQ